MDWKVEFEAKLVEPEEAVSVIKSGDTVCFSLGKQPLALGVALAARAEDLRNVRIIVPAPDRDFPWYESGWEQSFKVSVLMPLPAVYEMVEEHRCDIELGITVNGGVPWAFSEKPVDVFMLEVSPPDEHGFCSFGNTIWEKRDLVDNARIVLAEINERLIRTFGSNFVHVSEIDRFVKHTPSEVPAQSRDLRGATSRGPREELRPIASFVSELLQDGDTIEIGVGTTTEWLPHFGAFADKNDLGWHSEHTPGWVIDLVRSGVVNGARKNLHPGKAVATGFGGNQEQMSYVHLNPEFELYSLSYVADIRTIAAHDSFVAINNAISVDLTGQITAQSIGTRLFSAEGGHVCFVLGAQLSKGGRSIHVMPSTAVGRQNLSHCATF